MPALQLDANGALDLDTIYEPYPKQRQLHTNSAKNLLAIGGNGSGKSAFLLGESLYVSFEYPGASCLLLRRDFPELEKGLILDFKAMVPGELYRYNDQKHVVTFPNVNNSGSDSHIFFGHLQNGSERTLSQYLSSAFVFIGIDELGQFSYNAWSFLSSRNRVNRECKPSVDGYWPICRMAGATNPLGPGYGWIRKLWIEHKPVSQMGETTHDSAGRYYQEIKGKQECIYEPKDYFFVHSTVLDNPAQLEKDPDYIAKLQKLPPDMRKTALEGDLDSKTGAYFSNFTWDRNVRSLPRDHEDIQFEAWQPRWMSMDWGLAHFWCVHWHTRVRIRDPIDGQFKPRVLTYRELLMKEVSYKEGVTIIADNTPKEERATLKFCFLSPDRFRRNEHDPAHLIADEITFLMRQHQLPLCYKATDARVDGAVFMYNLIESGDWVILDSCPILIQSLETRVRNDKIREDVLKVDDEWDDAYDCARYGLVSMLKEKNKPEEVKLREKTESIADPTARMIYSYQHMLKQEERSKPIRQKIVPRWMAQQQGRR